MKNVWDYIQEMLIYKESLVFARKTYEGHLNDFGRFAEKTRIFSSLNLLLWNGA